MSINLGNINDKNENQSNVGGLKLNNKNVTTISAPKNAPSSQNNVQNVRGLRLNNINSQKVEQKKKKSVLDHVGDFFGDFGNAANEGFNDLIKLPGRTANIAKKVINESDVMKDGYNFGDISKTLGSTILSTAQNFGEGVIRGGEQLIDAGANLFGGTSDWVNTKAEKMIGMHKDKSEAEVNREKGQARKEMIQTNYTDKLMNAVGKDDFYKDLVESNSIVKTDNFGGVAAQGLGKQALNLLIAKGMGSSNKLVQSAPLATSAYGSSVQEAYQNGANWDEANRYGLLNAATETATEWLFDGIPGMKGSKGKGIDYFAEKYIFHEPIEKSSKTLAKSLLKSGYKLAGENTEEVLADLINPYLKQFTYEYNSNKDVLGNLKEATSKLPTAQDLLQTIIVTSLTTGVLELPSSISDMSGTLRKNNINSHNNTSTVLNETNQSNINNQTIQSTSQNGLKLQNNDMINNRYQYEQSENQKTNNLNESMSQYFDNSEQTHNLANTLSKIVEDKGYNVIFDDTLTNGNNTVNAQIKTLPNGESEIRINPNSYRAGEFLIMHEVTHAIETDQMKNLILDYASKNSEFNNALESLKQTYGTEDVSSEVVADISGQLFGNQEFINNLSTKQPNIFKRIYNAIISLANKLTGNSREGLFIKDLKNKWEAAYRTQNNQINDTEYMMTGKNGVNNAIKNNQNNKWLETNYNNAIKMNESGIDSDEIRNKTGWFQDKYGKWKFELSDEDAKIIKKPENNKKYKLSELLEHQDLYELYPKLKETTIKFKDLAPKTTKDGKKYEGYGYFNSITNTIVLNNSLINSNDKIMNTLLHEIQHRIQKAEGFKNGTSLSGTSEEYMNNFGEKEARDTSKRQKLSYQERIDNLPNSYIEKQLDNKLDSKKKKMYNLVEVDGNDSQDTRFLRNNILQIPSERDLRRGNKGRGLENSSFSLQENNKTWQEHLEENYKATGTRTNLNKIKGEYAPKTTKNIKESNIRKLDTELKKETPIKEINQKKIENNENAIKRLTQEKDALTERLQNKIKEKQELLKSKANKDSKLATQLNIQISNLNNQLQNRQLDYDKRIDYYKNKNEKMNTEEFKTQEQRITKRQEYLDQAYDMTENMVEWKDKKRGISYQINTMKRNLFDIMSKSEANKMYNTYFQPITENNAKSEKFINSYNNRIKKLNLNNKESQAVQMLGEYKYNKETLVTGSEVDEFISKNHLDYDKLSNAVEKFRTIYDELITETNKVLKEQGYKEIEYRKGYFPHFQEETKPGRFAKLAEKFGFKVNKNDSLPTDIAGMTEIFKPGKTYFKNAQRRLGKVTEYNALKGYDNYIRGAADLIFHTEDIQKLRALETVIRTQYTDNSIKETIEKINNNSDYDIDQKQALIDLEFAKINNPLPNLVTELRNYTDSLANKKDIGDRGMEHMLGRETYTIMKNVQSRVSANMVGFNISSALTNFIPITQAWGEVSTKNMAKAIKQSIANQFRNDGFVDASTYLINRTQQAERLYQTGLDKVNSKAGAIFEAVDSITSNVIVRGKYLDNIDRGMTEVEAIKNANEFAKDIMAGRSKGDMPTIFNRKNPIVKLFTAFQLEVNNQYGYMLKDLPRNLSDETKKKLALAFVKMFVGAWLYNKFSESVTGRKSAFSPIDIVSDSIETANNDNLSDYDKISGIFKDITQDVPFIGGLVGGGRLPINSAIPDVGATVESITQLTDDEKKSKAIKNLEKEFSKPLFYVALPFGGGQLKKTIEGGSMYFHETPGSYTSSGRLRFEAPKSPIGVAQSLLFGQYSSKNAREYFDNGYAPLTEKQIEDWKNLDISFKEYRKYRQDFTQINQIKGDKDENNKTIKGTAAGKKAFEIINSDSLSKKEKDYLLKSISSSEKYTITTEILNKIAKDENIYKYFYSLTSDNKKQFIKDIDEKRFDSYQLYDYYKTKKEYTDTYSNSYAKNLIINYLTSSNMTDNQKYYLYSKDYTNDDTVDLLRQFNVSANNYLNTMKYITEVKTDYQGDRYTNYRRQLIYSYIQGLNASILEKVILYKQAGYSISNYKQSLYNYIEGLSLTVKEKNKLWNQLY